MLDEVGGVDVRLRGTPNQGPSAQSNSSIRYRPSASVWACQPATSTEVAGNGGIPFGITSCECPPRNWPGLLVDDAARQGCGDAILAWACGVWGLAALRSLESSLVRCSLRPLAFGCRPRECQLPRFQRRQDDQDYGRRCQPGQEHGVEYSIRQARDRNRDRHLTEQAPPITPFTRRVHQASRDAYVACLISWVPPSDRASGASSSRGRLDSRSRSRAVARRLLIVPMGQSERAQPPLRRSGPPGNRGRPAHGIARASLAISACRSGSKPSRLSCCR